MGEKKKDWKRGLILVKTDRKKRKNDGEVIQDLRDRLRVFYLNGENSGLQSENIGPKRTNV